MTTNNVATVIERHDAPVFKVPGLVVTGLASPSRGARETSVWSLVLEPGAPSVPHAVSREEIFVVISGHAELTTGGAEARRLGPCDALIVPKDTEFALANPHEAPFEAVVAFPVGGVAITPDGRFTPPWAT
jgi:quercetin dioxygenase-like cupin family protein